MDFFPFVYKRSIIIIIYIAKKLNEKFVFHYIFTQKAFTASCKIPY